MLFRSFQFKKIMKHPSAGKQCLWYMCLSIAEEKLQGTWNGIDYTKGFVVTEDKNDQNFLVEVIDYDPKLVEVYVGRCEQTKIAYKRVFKERVMPGRPLDATKQDCKRCYTCPMNVACWEKGKAERIGE